MKLQRQRLLFPLIVLILSTATALFYTLQHPGVALTLDSPTYLTVVAKMTTHHLSFPSLVDPVRLPGYPLFIYAIASSNLSVSTLLQTGLFVLVALLTYWIALLAFDVPWIALALGLLIATDPLLLGYFRQIMTESLACFLLSALSLTSVLYIRSARPLLLVATGGLLFLLIFTRPEWIALPLLLFPLLLVAARVHKRGMLLQQTSIVIVLAACIYGCVGLYIQVNGKQNHYHGFSSITNMNLLGKVLQYNMEKEAPSSQQSHTASLESCIAQRDGNRDPWQLLGCTKDLAKPWAVPAGDYALSVVVSHPIEFVAKSVPVFFISLAASVDPAPSVTQASPLLSALSLLHQSLYRCNILVPLLIGWPLWLLWNWKKKKPISSIVWSITVLWCISCYGCILVALAGYSMSDYARFHSVFIPLVIITIWGSVLLLASLLLRTWQGSRYISPLRSATNGR